MLSHYAGEVTLGSDPNLRFTPGGKAAGDVRAVASSRKKQDDGTWADDKSSWVTLTFWDKLAENVVESLHKGDKVVVIGKFLNEEWTDSEGSKRTTAKVQVDSIGPSLAFATAKVTKAERSGGQGGGQQGERVVGGLRQPPADDPWATGPASDEPPF